jgi:hypothetical protein
MSVLPAGQSLRRFLPDLEELVQDPRGYLAQEPLTIGPRQMYGLAFLFGLAGGAFLASCVITGKPDGERLALGIGLLLGAAVWLGWSLMMRGHSLVLHPDGVEVRYRDTTVWCPWALLNVDGQAFVPDADNPRVGLTLPIATEALPFVELRRDDTPIAHGAEVKARQWQRVGKDTLVLPARYEVMAGELGELLLLLGRRLGRELPKAMPLSQAYDTGSSDDVPAAPSADGWITVHLAHLVFPPRCCACGEPTQRTMMFPLASRGDTQMSVMVPGSASELAIPVCETCRQDIRARQRHGGIRGMQVGASLFGVLVLVLAWSEGWQDPGLLLVVALLALAGGALIGFLIGTLASRRLPVELRGYSPSRGTLSLRFAHPDYAAQVLAAMRSPRKG